MLLINLLKCFAKALLRHAGNALGFGFAGDVLANVSEEVWDEWQAGRNEQQRRAELQAVVRMARDEFRQQVEEAIAAVANGLPREQQKAISQQLQGLRKQLQRSLRRPEDSEGRSVPPDLPLREASDFASLLSSAPARQPAAVAKITLTALAGELAGKEFVFSERTTCLLGRGSECVPRLLKRQGYGSVSRHHCLLDINPPDICVRDCGSRNGTFVNGKKIGKRPRAMTREEAGCLEFRQHQLQDGDELRLGRTSGARFSVRITLPEKQAAAKCVQCGRDVGDEAANRPGDYVCGKCRASSLPGNVPVVEGYTISKKLGRGGMGAVWMARQQRTGRDVAVKIMLPQIAANERAVKWFLEEMSSTRMLQHRHIVRLYEGGYSRGVFYLALEYCEAGSVASLMKERGGTLPIDEAVEITLQALQGLHYAHTFHGPRKGLVHRDLKPANLFLSGAGSSRIAKVGDYGLAKAFDEAGLSGSTRTGDVGGTPHFMPRQQVIRFKDPKPEIDVWAMAACLYNMLTGAVPREFPQGKDPWRIVLRNKAIPIRDRNAQVPTELAEVIDLALIDQPRIHFQSALAFKEALEEAL